MLSYLFQCGYHIKGMYVSLCTKIALPKPEWIVPLRFMRISIGTIHVLMQGFRADLNSLPTISK